MLQALISRMAVPGISNFINASVRCKRQRLRRGMSMVLRVVRRWADARQVLQSASSAGAGETRGTETRYVIAAMASARSEL